MIDKKDINTTGDDKFRKLMGDSQLTASENLKYRIMHQIETEQALLPKTIKSEKPVIRSIVSIACVMYCILLVITIATYLIGGVEQLISTEFILAIVGVASISGVYTLITVLDERRYKS